MHWCHGAVGLLPLLLEVEGLCSGAEAAKVHAAVERVAQVIWERDLLLKVGSMTCIIVLYTKIIHVTWRDARGVTL